jgi:hypothetical protein
MSTENATEPDSPEPTPTRWQYCRLAELEIAAGDRPRAGDVSLPEDTSERLKEWAEGEAEREHKREAFMGKLQAVAKDPMAALEEMD